MTFLPGLLVGLLLSAPLVYLLVRRTASRARDAERRARDAERLAELGTMTGGLAHEIKNPLSTIGLNAQLLTESLEEADLPAPDRERLVRRLTALRRETERLAGILNDFLQFAGRMTLAPERHDLVVVLDELADFFHPQCDASGVALHVQRPDTPVWADIDIGLFKQAVLNLMINAVQAMGDSGHRELILRLDASGDAARLHVVDTGPGIAEGDRDRIMRPYVSMRSGGTGLGLPTTRRIVEEHGGRLEIAHAPGGGAEFVVVVPRSS